MRPPFTLEQLATQTMHDVEELERYRHAQLIDPDGDGVFDQFDVLRLRLISLYRNAGQSLDEVLRRNDPGLVPFLHSILLGDPDTSFLSVDEVAARSGLEVERIQELRQATTTFVAGRMLSAHDADVMASVRRVMDAGVPWEAIIEAARVYGDALRRLASTEVRIARSQVDKLSRETGLSEQELSPVIERLVTELLPLLDPLIVHLHRQHLIRALAEDLVTQLEAQRSGVIGAASLTIVFVDLASFTSLAQVHGDEVAADVLDRFDKLVRRLTQEHGGGIVKQIGDAFMLTFRDAVDGLRFCIKLDEAAAGEWNFPALRMGVHSGEVLYRLGDYVGTTVNLAARIAALASANEILISKSVAAAALEADIPVEPVGEQAVSGFEEPVPLYRVVRTGGRAGRRERDPVCGMIVGPQAAARLLHGGFEFAFCSENCLRRFLEHPTRYTAGSRSTV